jgi:lysozyme family protein
MTPFFTRCVAELLEYEGGLVEHPKDPGGLTHFGISQRSYPTLDIRALTREDAITLYRRDFWTPLRCDDLPPAVAFLVFDGGVNQGTTAAALDLQKACRVKQDGLIGPATIGAALALAPETLITRVIGARGVRYAFTRNLSSFGEGWYLRLARAALFAFRLGAADLR